MQLIFQFQQLLALLSRQVGDRHPGQLGDDLRDMIGAHLCRSRGPVALPGFQQRVQFGLFLFQFLLQLGGAVELFARGGIVLLALDLGDLGLQLLHIDGSRSGADFDPCRGLVDQVDGLVGHEATGDIAVRQFGRGDNGLVGDRHLVVAFQHVAQTAQDHDRLGHGRLIDIDRLEAPFQRCILLDMLLVFVECGCTDQIQLTPCKRRFEGVGDIEPAFAAALARAHDGVQLVDEEHEIVLVGLDLLQHLLDSLLEFAAIFGACDHRVDVEFHQPLVAQGLGDFTGHDALCQPFDDRGLADAGFPDQDRVVLLTAGQNLDRGLDLARPADHRVELALARKLGQVAGEFVQIGRVRRGIDTAFFGTAPHHLGHLLAQRLRRQPVFAQDVGGQPVALFGKADQQMLGADIGMAQLVRGDEGPVERVLETWADTDLSAFLALSARSLGLDLAAQIVDVYLELFEQDLDHIAMTQREQQVFGIHFGTAEFACFLRGLLQELVALLAQAVGDTRAAASSAVAARNRDTLCAGFTTVVADAARHAAKGAVAEEFVEKRSAAKQGFQRRA